MVIMELVGYFKDTKERYLVLDRDNTIGVIYSEGNVSLTRTELLRSCRKPTNIKKGYYNIWLRALYGEYALMEDIIPRFIEYDRQYSKEEFDKLFYDTALKAYSSKKGLIEILTEIITIKTKEGLLRVLGSLCNGSVSFKNFQSVKLEKLYELLDMINNYESEVIQLTEDDLDLILKTHQIVKLNFSRFFDKSYNLKEEYEVRYQGITHTINNFEDLVISQEVGRIYKSSGDFCSCTVEYCLPAGIDEDLLRLECRKRKSTFANNSVNLVYEKLMKSKDSALSGIRRDWLSADILFRPNFRIVMVKVSLKESIRKVKADMEKDYESDALDVYTEK